MIEITHPPEGFSLVETQELARLRAVDAKHGWKERPPPAPDLHAFFPSSKGLFCKLCGYGPGEPLKHVQPVRKAPQ